MYKSYFYIFFCSFDLLTTRIANLSVEDIPKPEYLQTNAYYWCNSFWYLYRGLVLNRKWNVFSTVSSIVQLLLFSVSAATGQPDPRLEPERSGNLLLWSAGAAPCCWITWRSSPYASSRIQPFLSEFCSSHKPVLPVELWGLLLIWRNNFVFGTWGTNCSLK